MDDSRLILSCHGCVMHATSHCDDCLVTALTSDAPVALDPPTLRAVSALQRGDLLPPLRKVVSITGVPS